MPRVKAARPERVVPGGGDAGSGSEAADTTPLPPLRGGVICLSDDDDDIAVAPSPSGVEDAASSPGGVGWPGPRPDAELPIAAPVLDPRDALLCRIPLCLAGLSRLSGGGRLMHGSLPLGIAAPPIVDAPHPPLAVRHWLGAAPRALLWMNPAQRGRGCGAWHVYLNLPAPLGDAPGPVLHGRAGEALDCPGEVVAALCTLQARGLVALWLARGDGGSGGGDDWAVHVALRSALFSAGEGSQGAGVPALAL